MIKSLFHKILLIVLIGIINSNSQSRTELDSLFNVFLYVKGIQSQILPDAPAVIDEEMKCGLNLVNTIRFNQESFSPEQQDLLKVLLQRPNATHSLITPSGKFKIHYNQTGQHSPGYNINLLAEALDSVYRFEIEFLGYDFPPGDSLYDPNGSYGGDNRYDVYVQNLSGLYGYTQFEVELQPGLRRYTSFMVIDNDFAGFYTTGINGARVTVAHEFHHAIQGGNYIFRSDDTYFYEITSTAMEEFVYDSINDYYAYMNDYFQSPSRAFPNNNGYNLAIWHIFLKDRYGFGIIKRQWELMPTNRALSAISKSIQEEGSVFEFELALFGLWSYFTNYRSVSGAYFEEARFYPSLSPTANPGFTPPSQSYTISGFPAANYFMRTFNPARGDTIVSIFGNGDFQKALGTSITTQSADYTLFFDTTSGDYKLGEFYSASFNPVENPYWRQAEIINNIPLTGDSIQIVKDITANVPAFPSPYRYNDQTRSGEFIKFPVELESNKEVDISIYSVSMDLVNTFQQVTKPHNLKEPFSNVYRQISVVKWDKPVNEKGENLASGVYIYVIKSGNEYTTGKFVIFNE